jgi:hypothetical protein
MKRAWAAAATVLCLALSFGAGAAVLAQGKPRVCLAPEETREAIVENSLIRPVVALRMASVQFNAEPVSVKLCRWGADFVYEIALLHRDGRVLHAFMNAATGDIEGSRNAH